MPSRVGEFHVTIRPIRLTGVTHGEAVKLRFDFDHFKKWKSTTAVAAPTAHWNMERDEVKFVYKTEHMAELNQKLFTIEVDGHSTLGVCTVDLLTLATGPNEFRLPYIHHRATLGHVHFRVEMKHLTYVSFHTKEVRLSMSVGAVPMAVEAAFLAHVAAGSDRFLSTKPQPGNRVFNFLPTVTVQSSYDELIHSGIVYRAKTVKKGFFHNDEDVLGSGSVHFDRRFTFRDSEFKPFEISLSRVSDGAVVGKMTGQLALENTPQYVQMVGGYQDEHGIHGARLARPDVPHKPAARILAEGGHGGSFGAATGARAPTTGGAGAGAGAGVGAGAGYGGAPPPVSTGTPGHGASPNYPPTTGYPPTGASYPSPGAGYPPTGAGYPPTGAGYPPTGAGYPPTNPAYPSTGAGYPSTGYPSTGAGYGAGYPSSGGSYPTTPRTSAPSTPSAPYGGYGGYTSAPTPPHATGGMTRTSSGASWGAAASPSLPPLPPPWIRKDERGEVTFYNTAESYSERTLPSTPFYYVDVQHSGQIGMELKTSPTGMGAIMSGVVPGSQLDRAGVVRPGHVLVSVAGKDVSRMVFDDVQAFILGVLARPMRLGFTNPHAVPAHIASAHNAAPPATSATTHSHHQLAGAGRSLMHSALNGLPPNWERRVDASSGREYFQNNVTHTTQWERPT